MIMMKLKSKFISYFEGYFDNQKQAFHMPREFALIEVNHRKLTASKFTVSQKYVIDEHPYRESIVEVTQEDEKIILKSYKKDGKSHVYLPGCDVEFVYDSEKDEFHGRNNCNECYVDKDGRNTYLMTNAILGNNYYNVIDRGLSPETNEQLWGSFHGMFQFDRK
jgi:CpeT protein